MKKKILSIISAVTMAFAIFFAPQTNFIPISAGVTASAATTSLTRSDIDAYDKAWKKHPYCLGVGIYGNKLSSGKKCILGWQKMLNLVMDAGLDEDSGFGNLTQKATISFQKSRNLGRDGIVGNESWNRMVEEARKRLDEIEASRNDNSGLLIDPNAIYIDQYNGYIGDRTSSGCTICSVGMMIRAKAIINGSDSAISEKSIYNAGWTRYGCLSDFTVSGITATSINISRKTKNNYQKTVDYLVEVLKDHPEGIVCYAWTNNSTNEHAVYLSADTTKGFKILDPAHGAEYISFSDSANSISRSVGNISQIWYVVD